MAKPSDIPRCAECGGELPPGLPRGLCPLCALRAAAEASHDGQTAPVPVAGITHQAGDRIGRYKLLQKIGEGGMGEVWMAEQSEPIRRKVALKVVKLGMDTKQFIARFEAERQALALMDHPNIARVLDAGATETGRPYFVMELVRGVKITAYCDGHSLPMRARLDLFMQVCHAIQHAHQKGVIHRDIKPSNILVTLHDGVPVPKVIDFGIAKATSGLRLTEKTLFTAFEQFIGTPAYMSPEQAEMSGLDIDTRSDIYSLGVLLYELLTGKTPFDGKELLASGLDAMRRTIREKEPVKPSTRLSTLNAEDLSSIARHRGSEPPKLINLVRGDLDSIAMKCLEKDRTRRFDSASALALDLVCHLENRPVAARPPSRVYQFRKIVRRNRLAFGASSAVILALLSGIIISTHLYLKERQARRDADMARAGEKKQQERAETKEAEGREAEARLVTYRLEAAIDLRDWVAASDCLDELRTRFAGTVVSTSSFVKWGEVWKQLPLLISEEEREARKRMGMVQEVALSGDPIRANALLNAFTKRYGSSHAAVESSNTLRTLRTELDRGLIALNPVVGDEYVFYPAVRGAWSGARKAADSFFAEQEAMKNRFGQRVDGRGTTRLLVLRVILDDEAAEDELQIEAKNSCLREHPEQGPAYSPSRTLQARSGALIYVDADTLKQESEFQIGALRHASPVVRLRNRELADTGNLIEWGTYVIQSISPRNTGRLKVKFVPESGSPPPDRLVLERFVTYKGWSFRLEDGTFSSGPIAAGTYSLRPEWSKGMAPAQHVTVKRGETTELNIPAFCPRRVTFDWLFRRPNISLEWKKGTDEWISGRGWVGAKDWEAYCSVSDLTPWDGDSCMVYGISSTCFPLEKIPPSQSRLPLPRTLAHLHDKLRVGEGTIVGFHWGPEDFTNAWEAVIQVRTIKSIFEDLGPGMDRKPHAADLSGKPVQGSPKSDLAR